MLFDIWHLTFDSLCGKKWKKSPKMMKYTESWMAFIQTCAWKFLVHFALNMFLIGCSGGASYKFIQRFFAISSVFLSCSSCLLGCMCLQQVGLPPRQADGYVRVSAGYLQVMGTPQTRPAKPETSPRSKSHFTWTAFTCCPSNPVVHLFIPKLVPGQLLTMINKV